MISPVEGFAIGLVAGGAAVYGLWTGIRWFRTRADLRAEAFEVPAAATSPHSYDDEPRPRVEVVPDLPTTGLPIPDASYRSAGPPTAVRPASPSPGSPTSTDPARLSRRIVLHLYSLGRIDPDDVAPFEATQRGIGRSLGAEQSAISKVLGRLAAAEVVEAERRHVRGGDRRVKVYTLTRRGELIARELRLRRAARDPEEIAHPASFVGRP